MLADLFVVLAVGARFATAVAQSGWWNFTPVGASLLFFGSRRPRRELWAPLALMAASDVVLTLFVYRFPFSPDHLITWAWYGVALLLGGLLCKDSKPLPVFGAALATSVSFFLISNFAVWGIGHAVDNMYPKTMAGLVSCYAAGVPFFRYTVASDLMFSALFFGIAALIESRQAAQQHLSA